MHVLFEVIRREEHDHTVGDHRADIDQYLTQLFELINSRISFDTVGHRFSRTIFSFFLLSNVKSKSMLFGPLLSISATKFSSGMMCEHENVVSRSCGTLPPNNCCVKSVI